MINILIAEAEPKACGLLRRMTDFSGHKLTETESGITAVETLRQGSFDVVLLDIALAELDGFSVCREIRKTSEVPIIFISARNDEYDRINAFEAGADDYVVKPFSTRELMLRIEAILRRYNGIFNKEKHDTYAFGGLSVDLGARMAELDGEPLSLSPKEYGLLHILILNKGITLSREQLLTSVWGFDYFGDERTLDTHIKLLRKNLGRYAECISTLRGVGYRYDEKNI